LVKTPLWFLALLGKREIKHNWAQFLAIIGIGGIAVTLFVGLLANAESIEERVDYSYNSGAMADLWVTTSSYKEVDQKKIAAIVGEKGSVEGRFEAPGRVARNSVYSVITPSLPTISKPYAIAEASADHSSTHFVLVDTALAHGTDEESNKKFQVGQSLSVDYDISSYIDDAQAAKLDAFLSPGGTNIFKQNSITLSYTITGLMSYPENIKKASYSTSTFLIDDTTFKTAVQELLSKNFSAEGQKYIFEAMNGAPLGWGDGTPECPGTLTAPNQYLVSLKNHADSEEVKKGIQNYFDGKGDSNLYNLSDRANMPFVITMHNDVVQARQFTFLFPFVFFFVAILVILTTTSQIILKERTQIGTLKALGLSNKEIYAHYIMLTSAVVGIGILLGEVIGPILIPFILGKKYDILYTLPARTYVFPWLYGLLTAVVFLGVSALVTYLVCHKEVVLKPAESMRPVSLHIKKHDEKIHLPKKSVRFLSLKMAFRNILIDKLKSVMVVVGVMGCTALLLCGFGIEDTVYYGINHDMELGNNADISLTFSAPQSQATLAQDLHVEGVASYEPMTRSMSTISLGEKESNSYLYILAKDQGSHMKVDFPLDKVALSEKAANETGAKVGDKVRFSYGSFTYEEEVAVVYKAFIFNGVMLHASNPDLLAHGEVTFQGAYIDKTPEADLATLKGVLQGISYVIEADTQADWWNQINDIMSGVLVMTNAVKVFAILLAIVVLYNLALLNFRERTRDIATLKVLGFSKKEIASSLLWETMSLTFLGVFFGMFLGYPFLLGVMKLNIVDLVQYLYTILPVSYLYSFLLTFVVAFVVNLALSFRTGQVKMVESLKSVE
jgi:putative ABC transport system permease protein